MFIRRFFLILVLSLIFAGLSGQNSTYIISKALFSSDLYDEFCPVYFRDGIVFCSNRSSNPLSNYSSSEGIGLFNILYIDTTAKISWQRAEFLSKSLKTNYNDGPASFNQSGDTIFFSRNQKFEGKLKKNSNVRNKLGVFMAVKDGKNWTRVKELRFNNEWYNITMPCLSPDGKKLFFASDKPGGYGGSDLYYCQWEDGYWDRPVNLGAEINTEGNESYPFINSSGDLFFSSDGHPGLGGKDIFFSKNSGQSWLDPVHLDPPINSEFDDFGIITDSTISNGYFSSNRENSIDIYNFKTAFPQIFYFADQRTNQNCFRFKDDGLIEIDTIKFQYEWDFGDGARAKGPEVEHCFPGPGSYFISQRIIERVTGRHFFTKLSYDLSLRDIEQAYISGPMQNLIGEPCNFDGHKSNLPGYKILGYSWDFGDGEKARGSKVSHSYIEPGEYYVKLGLTLVENSTGKIQNTGVSRKILVGKDSQQIASIMATIDQDTSDIIEVENYDHVIIESVYSAGEDFQKGAVFQVEILSSDDKLDLNSNIFKNVPQKYLVKEVCNPDSTTYSYIIDQQIDLMATYIAYRDMVSSGFKETRTKIEVLRDPAAKELNSLKKAFGVSTDSYFDTNGMLTSTAYLFLDNLLRIMNKYPDSQLEIGVHTDSNGSTQDKLIISQRYAQTFVDYLTNRGIDSNRLIAKGFGESRPVAPNFLANDRKLNRRVDFTITRE